jgi:hypothetical protein
MLIFVGSCDGYLDRPIEGLAGSCNRGTENGARVIQR